MKLFIAISRWLPVAGLILLFTVGCGPTQTTVASIATSPAQFDGKNVAVRGRATDVDARTSRAGNDYTMIQVRDEGAAVTVFTWGHPDIWNGDRIEVEGLFERAKRVGSHVFFNELSARSIRPLVN